MGNNISKEYHEEEYVARRFKYDRNCRKAEIRNIESETRNEFNKQCVMRDQFYHHTYSYEEIASLAKNKAWAFPQNSIKDNEDIKIKRASGETEHVQIIHIKKHELTLGKPTSQRGKQNNHWNRLLPDE